LHIKNICSIFVENKNKEAMKNVRFTKGQEIYRICSIDKEITTVTVRSCGEKRLVLVSEFPHGSITPTTTYDGYLTYHSTYKEAELELNK
tara:strand:+ start:59 stop:328 length:270 start_codon:yes stop_codon:yes gene_type:complete